MQLVQDMYANLNNADLDSVVENTNKAPYVSIWDLVNQKKKSWNVK